MDNLTKLYVEITAHCNLQCEMCVQRVWHETIDSMPLSTFEALVDDLSALPNPPAIHLGGYGEPMVHPNFLDIVRIAKEAGLRVEMTTNGTMLTREKAEALYHLGLDELNVSIDGVTPDQYSNIRVNGNYNRVIENVRYLHGFKLRRGGRFADPQIAISFVAMKSNIDQLPQLPRLASYLGAWRVKVSNVVPHTPAMEQEILYDKALNAATYRSSRFAVDVSIPKIDFDDKTGHAFHELYDTRASVTFLGETLSRRDNYCRFAQEGFAAIRWDGEVSPCLSLMHSHPEYIRGRRKNITHYGVGNINDKPMSAIWQEFAEFRQQVRDFEFSPCTTCGGCERFSENQEDCTEHHFPVCGGCLWAQGIIECP